MMLQSKIILCLFAFVGVSFAAAIKQKRDALVTTLYAYGTNITGLSVFFVDGLAFIGNSTPDFANVAANITLSTDESDPTTPWTAISSNSTSNSSSAIDGASLYIIPTPGSTAQVGFLAKNGTAPSGAVTAGFTWFGSQVAYIADETEFEMHFWAVKTNTTELWSLVWNADGELIEDATPVALKRTAPVVLTLAA